jgi:transposase
MKFDITIELKNIILKTKSLKNTYEKTHTNSKYTLDLIIHELLYFLKSGVSWRMLRSPINYKTLFWHYSNFVKNNVFYKLFTKIRNTYIKKYIMDDCKLLIDSTIVYNKSGINKIGRNKFYKNKKTTKISLMTDINGFPLSIFFLKGNYHDNSVFDKHIRDACLLIPNNKKIIMADKAYASRKNYLLLESKNIGHIIPPRKNMKICATYKYDINEYKKRIRIEHIFGRLKINKRLNSRYNKKLTRFSGFVLLALSIIGINIINKK